MARLSLLAVLCELVWVVRSCVLWCSALRWEICTACTTSRRSLKATGPHTDLIMLQGAVNPLQILNPTDFQTWLSGQ
jgi:hypothetical protein